MTISANNSVLLGGLTITNGNSKNSGANSYYCGGIYNSGTLTIVNCSILKNTARGAGGGIYNTGELTVVNSTISENKASMSGGGLYNYGFGTNTITNSTISGNISSNSGGGIYNTFGKFIITNCTISENSASNGGGIYNTNRLTITNSMISGNVASTNGGGIYNEGGAFTVVNSTISGNTASNGDGSYQSGTLTITNSIFIDAIYKESGAISGSYNLTTFTGWSTGSSNNIVYDSTKPLFVDDANGDYHLSTGSQAINKGSNSLAVDANGKALVYDLDNLLRITNGTVDLGAYEYHIQLSNPTLSALPMGVNSIKVTVGKVANASGYVVEYSTSSDFDNAVTQNISAGETTIVGLSANTTYYFRALAIGEGNYRDSEFSSSTFATTERIMLNTPTLNSSVEKTIVALFWNEILNASGYQFEYQLDGSDNWTITTGIQGTSTAFIGNFGSTYSVRVKANGTGIYTDSPYSETLSITLAVPATQITNLTLSTDSPTVGTVITTTLSPSDATVEYQWYCGETAITGATESSFTVTEEQIGQTITCVAIGTGNYTGSVSGTTAVVPALPLDKPNVPTLTLDGTTITATWSAVDNASTYTVEYQATGSDTWTTIPNISGTTTSFVCLTGTTYNVKVKANGTGNYSDSAFSESTPVYIPIPLNDLTLSTYAPEVGTAITASFDQTGITAEYQWYCGETPITNATESSFLVTEEQIGQTITCVATGIGNYTGTVSATTAIVPALPLDTPNVPTLTEDDTIVIVSWSKVTNASSYTVEYQVDGSDGWFVITGINGTTTSFVGVAGATYNVKVQANGTGNYSNSEFSEVASITLAVPPIVLTGLTLSSDAPIVGTIITTTLAPSDATVEYQWYCGTTIIDKATASSFTVTESQIGQTITCVATGTGNYTGTVSATTAVIPALLLDTPNAPTLSAEDTSIMATWSAVSNASSYTVQHQIDGSDGWMTITDILGTAASFVGIAGTTYNVRVQANGTGNYSDSNYSEVASITLAVPPTQLTGLVLSTNSPEVGTVLTTTLTPSDATVEYQWYSGSEIITGATASSYTVTEEQIGQTITCVAIGTDNYTGTVSATTAVVPALPLDTPTAPSLTVEDTLVTATWSKVTNASSYTVEYQADGSDGWFVIAGINGTTTSFIGIAGTTYNVRVQANGTGNYSDSSYSEVASITLPVPPTQITGLTLSTTTPEVGSVITTTLLPSDATVDYQWYCGETAIIGAIESSFTVTEDQIGQTITCVVTANGNYTGVVSAITAVVPALPLDTPDKPTLTVEDTTISVSWLAVEHSSGYTVEYKFGSSDWSVLTTTVETTALLIGQPGIEYSFRVKANGTNIYADSEYSTADTISIADTLDAHNDFVKTTPNSPVVIDYRENDDAMDWSAVTVQFGEASHGEYIVSEDGTISYTPENGFFGTDLISYVLVSPSGKLAPGAITINVDLPIATSVQKTSSSHSPSTEMAASVERLTDWDNCCIELWASDVNELNSGETTVTLEYNPAVYNVPYFSACSEGVALATSEGIVLPNGNVEIQLTVHVLEALESQTDNLFLGTVVLKPTSEEEGSVDDVLTPEPVCTLNGTDLSTTVQSMPFDLIRNGIIDVNDFIAFATVFGLKSENMSSENPLYNHTVMSDFDANGIVDVNDFIAFATYFGISKKTAVKPIPQASAATDSEDCGEIQLTQNEVAVYELVYEEQIQEPLPATSSVPVLIPENEAESSMTLLEAYSATLLDLYDNQNQSATPTALFAKAVDESLAFDDDSFDFLFDESDSDADDNSDVDLSVVLDELDWELI